MYTFLSLKLHSNDTASVSDALADKVQQAPGFFANTPVVVDLTLIEDDSNTDAQSLLDTIRRHKLVPVVVSISDKESVVAGSIDIPLVEAGNKKSTAKRNTDTTEQSLADSASDPNLDAQASASTSGPKTTEDSPTQPADEFDNNTFADSSTDAEPEHTESKLASDSEKNNGEKAPGELAMAVTEVEYIIKSPKLVNKPVRSGQQIYARDTDLVVIGQVGPGAEIIADNNVHVYGPLRGRALCGVAGNAQARIFCQSLEAELVSVAGNYKVLEEIPSELRGKPAQIWYHNDKLMIEPL